MRKLVSSKQTNPFIIVGIPILHYYKGVCFMEKPIEKENKNEYVVIGLAISQESQIDGQAYLKVRSI